MHDFDAVILAAGLSRRMGKANKLLLEWHGIAIIRQVVMTYLAAIDGQVTVVTGHDADLVQDALSGLPIRLCHNPDFESGRQSSVALGLGKTYAAKAVLIGLGDQPLLREEDIRDFTARHMSADQNKISIPVQDETPGNPIVVPTVLRTQLLTNNQRPGCKRFIKANPDHVQEIPCRARGFFTDIDTPESYAVLRGKPHETCV